ncbi:unnamed protein product [Blepharisma stoltei]|uniref:Uncharacterized protein n=1 Tax=Blepharisma stoltei TaxID=1481888 RepID=A0AAU9ID87_9CILI|nr:unnamed protein product [Blepharisma stoltei]
MDHTQKYSANSSEIDYIERILNLICCPTGQEMVTSQKDQGNISESSPLVKGMDNEANVGAEDNTAS